ncbi:MAG: hypothetical protein [Wendovervirus sonii]|uniref:Uncharacterized protein n=1 Tax=phage Lak_Megaphage_Sonny TaxID=3109229 RepID=A0ABZ0Z2P7_9CAUD|nr:MAG: hypothetical protein [phage Lak_Megaphage_Sonny]
MSNEEAYKLIENLSNSAKQATAVIGNMPNEHVFESVLKRVIFYKWAQQFPEHFLNCYVTTDEYQTNCCTGYSYYTATINGSFNYNLYGITGADKFHLVQKHGKEEGEELYQKRLVDIIDSAKNAENIITWCVEHYAI